MEPGPRRNEPLTGQPGRRMPTLPADCGAASTVGGKDSPLPAGRGHILSGTRNRYGMTPDQASVVPVSRSSVKMVVEVNGQCITLAWWTSAG